LLSNLICDFECDLESVNDQSNAGLNMD